MSFLGRGKKKKELVPDVNQGKDTAEQEIRDWLEELYALTEQSAVLEKVEQFDLSGLCADQDSFNKMLEMMGEAAKEFDPQRFPLFLEALYRSDNKDKFILFCYLLDIHCENLAYLTNLENYDIYVAKFQVLLPALISVIERCWNGIGDCMYLILLKAVNNKELFSEKDVQRITEAALSEASELLDWIDETQPAPEEIPVTLEILMDVARHFSSSDMLELAQRALGVNNNSLKIFAAMALLAGGRTVSSAALEPAAADPATASKLLEQLEAAQLSELFPQRYAAQEHIAKSHLCNWLTYPTELNGLPDEIACTGTFEHDFGEPNEPDVNIFYVFKFRSDQEAWRDKGWMVGLSGGYHKQQTLTSDTTGHTFSEFEALEGDGIAQGRKIFDFICEHWKKHAAQAQGADA